MYVVISFKLSLALHVCSTANTIMAIKVGILLLTIIAPLNGLTLIQSVPPQPNDAAKMARYIIHTADWVSISTISTNDKITSFPFVNLESISDGPKLNGTGIPYFYMTPIDLTSIDIEKDNRCTILASLAETDYCTKQDYDPEDPRCARVMISGRLVKVDDQSEEHKFAKSSLFSRHPTMKYWPVDHGWYIGKLDVECIMLFDYFGGIKYVSSADYFKANLTYIAAEDNSV